ncbi:MAG: TraR/DksA family transcriptional regulator [Marmoricola sp.]
MRFQGDGAAAPDGLEAVLAAERARTTQRLEALRADFAAIVAASEGSNADDEHDPEGATIAFERSQVQALIDQATGRLEELDRALAGARSGRYGVCEGCGEPIDPARLAVRPGATRCVACAERRR